MIHSFDPLSLLILQPITLLLESVAAKDLSCLIAGYCKLLVDPQICVFPWTAKSKSHRISAEEGTRSDHHNHKMSNSPSLYLFISFFFSILIQQCYTLLICICVHCPGYVSRCGSDSEDSDTDVDALLAHVARATPTDQQVAAESSSNRTGVEQERDKTETEKEDKRSEMVNGTIKTEKVGKEEQTNLCVNEGEVTDEEKNAEKEDKDQEEKEVKPPCIIIIEDAPSEASDSFRTDSRFLHSVSSDSMDALLEDDFLTYCSTSCPSHLDMGDHYLQSNPNSKHQHCEDNLLCSSDFNGDTDPFVCFAALSNIAECLPSPPEASEDEDYEEQADEVDEPRQEEGSERTQPQKGESVFTFEQGDTRCYYKICTNVTPDSARSLPRPPSPPTAQNEEQGNGQSEEREAEPIPILQPPPGFGDSSSDDEFFDAQERFTSPEELAAMTRGLVTLFILKYLFMSVNVELFLKMTKKTCSSLPDNLTEHTMKRALSLSDIGISVGEYGMMEQDASGENEEELQVEMENELSRFRKRSRKRRSFMETDYTSLVSFPDDDHQANSCNQIPNHRSGPGGLVSRFDGGLSDQGPCPTVLSLTNAEGEPAQLETKPITPSKPNRPGTQHLLDGDKISKSSQRKQQLMLMEPDSMEFKSVTQLMSAASPGIVASRTCVDPKAKENHIDSDNTAEDGSAASDLVKGFLDDHLFFATSRREKGDSTSHEKTNDHESLIQGLSPDHLVQLKTCSLPRLGQTSLSSSLCLQVPTISCTPSPKVNLHEQIGIRKSPVEPFERHRSQSMSAAFGRRVPFASTRHVFPQREPLFCTKEFESDDTDSSSDPSEPTQAYLLSPCSSGILGRLSASTLRGKIQNLPLYLSRSQELLDGNASLSGNAKPMRRFSETRPRTREVDVVKEEVEDATVSEVTEVKVVTIVSEEVTEVIEEVREVSHINPQVHGQQKTEPVEPHQPFNSPSYPQPVAPVKISPSSVVVTTQNLNGPWGVMTSREIGGLQGGSSPLVGAHLHLLTSGCGMMTSCESKPTNTQPKALPSPCPHGKPDLSCSSALAMGCETVMEGAETPLEVCGCKTVYTNCFSGVLDSASFDDELTVYEFSCRTRQGESDQTALITSVPPSSLSGSPSSFSPSSPLPSFPHMVLPPSSSVELGPLLSPLHAPDCFLSDPHEDAIAALLSRHYPLPPTGFLALQRDVGTLLAVLAGAMKDQDGVQEHPRETCAGHFSENKQRLHVEARGLLAGCQQVVRVDQTPAETLQALAESFHSLVQLTSVCLSFSSCQRCRERHTQALSGLADLAQTYQEFARAAERVGNTAGKRTCHDLSIKLLARQCTALTTSVFCLTQLFRTLTAL